MSHNKHEHGNPQARPTEEEALKRCAYKLWEQAGRPEGQSERFWREAEARTAEEQRQVTTGQPHYPGPQDKHGSGAKPGKGELDDAAR